MQFYVDISEISNHPTRYLSMTYKIKTEIINLHGSLSLSKNDCVSNRYV